MFLQLAKNELLTIDVKRNGLRVRCRSGRLWVTQAGDSRDHLLGAGQEVLLLRGGRVVIHALEESLCAPEVPGRRTPRVQLAGAGT